MYSRLIHVLDAAGVCLVVGHCKTLEFLCAQSSGVDVGFDVFYGFVYELNSRLRRSPTLDNRVNSFLACIAQLEID